MVAMPAERGTPGRPGIAETPDFGMSNRDAMRSTRVATPEELLNAASTSNDSFGSSPTLDSVEQQEHRLPEPILSEWVRMQTMRAPTASEANLFGPTGPLLFIQKLVGFWNLEAIDAAELLGFDRSDAGHVWMALDGRSLIPGRDLADRIAHLVAISATLRSLFRDLKVENDWLRETHEALDNRSPLSLLLGGSMEDLLFVREYVDAAAGR